MGDRSDWVLITSTALTDDLAYITAKTAVEDWEVLESYYRGEPDRSMDPLKPELMWKNVGIPLHPGAERYYREIGYIK